MKNPETIKIGVIVSLTGNSGILGDYTLKGVQYAVDEQNSKVGLLGRKIELDLRDSKADPKEGINVICKMMEQKNKPFMVYSITSGVSQAIKPETKANKIILMSAVGTDRFLEESKFTVRNFVAAATIGKQIKESGYSGKIIGDPLMAYPDVEKAAGSALKGIHYLDLAFNPKSKDTTTRAFIKGFESKFKTLPQNFSVITYDGVKLLFSIIEKAGTLNPDVIIEELNHLQDYEGVFGPVSVSERNIKYRFVFKTWN